MGCRWVRADRLDRTSRLDENMEAMQIVEIRAGGAIHSYNAHQASLGLWQYVILSDVHIEVVNNVTGSARDMMQEATSASGQIELQVRRVERNRQRFKESRHFPFMDGSMGQLQTKEAMAAEETLSATVFEKEATTKALDKLMAEETVKRKNFQEEEERLQAMAEEWAQGLSGDDAEKCRSDAAQEAAERELLELARQGDVQEEIAQLNKAKEKAEQAL